MTASIHNLPIDRGGAQRKARRDEAKARPLLGFETAEERKIRQLKMSVRFWMATTIAAVVAIIGAMSR